MKTKPRDLWEASAGCNAETEEPLLDLLGRNFEGKVASYHDLESGRITVSVYLEDPALWRDSAGQIEQKWRQVLETDFPRFHLRRVRHEDWAESWKRHFKPRRFGARVWVRPSWRKVQLKRGELEVVLDPGLSFGTGQHPTTGFCLQEIARLRKRRCRQSLLDVGTGSGILAITAAKLGYGPIEAFDLDPDAIRVARENARNNAVGKSIRFSVRDVSAMQASAKGRFEVVCANLLANIITENCDRLLAAVQPGGALVAAGILATEFESVRKALEARHWRLAKAKKEKEWRSGTFVKR